MQKRKGWSLKMKKNSGFKTLRLSVTLSPHSNNLNLADMPEEAVEFLKRQNGKGKVIVNLSRERPFRKLKGSDMLRAMRPGDEAFANARNELIETFLRLQDKKILFDFKTTRGNSKNVRDLSVVMRLIVTLSKI